MRFSSASRFSSSAFLSSASRFSSSSRLFSSAMRSSSILRVCARRSASLFSANFAMTVSKLLSSRNSVRLKPMMIVPLRLKKVYCVPDSTKNMNLVIPPETFFSTDFTIPGRSDKSVSLKVPFASKTILSGLLRRYDEKVGFSSALSKIR